MGDEQIEDPCDAVMPLRVYSMHHGLRLETDSIEEAVAEYQFLASHHWEPQVTDSLDRSIIPDVLMRELWG